MVVLLLICIYTNRYSLSYGCIVFCVCVLVGGGGCVVINVFSKSCLLRFKLSQVKLSLHGASSLVCVVVVVP